MLQGFCQGGVPCQVPMPYDGDCVPQLPGVVITVTPPAVIGGLGANSTNPYVVTMLTPGFSSAEIIYSLDGDVLMAYRNLPLKVAKYGNHTILAYAAMDGYLQSATVITEFSI